MVIVSCLEEMSLNQAVRSLKAHSFFFTKMSSSTLTDHIAWNNILDTRRSYMYFITSLTTGLEIQMSLEC